MSGVLAGLDQDVLLAINGAYNDVFDAMAMVLSNKYVWIPLYLVLAYRLFTLVGPRRFVAALLLAGLAILIADQTCSGFLKPTVGRLRPCHDPALSGLLHMPGGCGGMYGFASSHAANFFAWALFLGNILRPWHPRFLIAFLIISFFVSLSRVYLGVHYPGDVIAGGAIGALAGGLCYIIYRRVSRGLIMLTDR